MSVNLTTRYLAKVHANESLTTTTYDALIDILINQVSEAIAQACGRVFESTTYRKWFDGTGDRYLFLPEYPVTRLYSASINSIDVAKVKNTSAIWANVSVKDGVMYLNSTNSSGTDAAESTIALATYKIISTLATQIATISGWACTVDTGQDAWASLLIRDIDGEWAVSPNDVTLEVPDEPEQARISSETNQCIEMVSPSIFPAGSKNIFIWYKAGYTLPAPIASSVAPTTAGDVPNDLTYICNDIIKQCLGASKQEVGVYNSERIGNYSYSIGPETRAAIQAGIESYRAALYPHKSTRLI